MTAPRRWPRPPLPEGQQPEGRPPRAEALNAELKETAKQLEILKAQVASAKIDGLFENAADIDGVRIVSRLPDRHRC